MVDKNIEESDTLFCTVNYNKPKQNEIIEEP
jgi:hypothetical protein